MDVGQAITAAMVDQRRRDRDQFAWAAKGRVMSRMLTDERYPHLRITEGQRKTIARAQRTCPTCGRHV